MEQEIKKDIKIICPNCKKELSEGEYEEITRYHNCITGICKVCGYEEHWQSFKKL